MNKKNQWFQNKKPMGESKESRVKGSRVKEKRMRQILLVSSTAFPLM